MKTPETSRHFVKWTDQVSGVESYLLNSEDIPLIQSFYFVNKSFTDDGRYLWFYCAFPPSEIRCLGVMDFETDIVRFLPETQFLDASPLIDQKTGYAYWASGTELWKIAPVPGAKPEYVNCFPQKIAKGRRPYRLATHFTFCADGKSVNFDIEVGEEWYLGTMPLDGSSPEIWESGNVCMNHAQFSPTDPELMLFAHDGWRDHEGNSHGYTKRMWIIRKGQKPEPIFPDDTPKHGHEWWDAGGQSIWYVHYGKGTGKVNVSTRKTEIIWPNGNISHSHSSADGRYLASDISAYTGSKEIKVLFYDSLSKKETAIVSSMRGNPDQVKYHIHPHPQFCMKDKYLCYTTMVLGRANMALTPVKNLI